MHRYNGIIDTQSPLADGAQLTKLDNGIRIVTDYMPHVASVSLGLWVDAGARYETLEENGMSHLLEHMLFKGTLRRSLGPLQKKLKMWGGI